MKRQALLIGPDFQELPGVKADINAWRLFLSSRAGGAWSDSEIYDMSELVPEGPLTFELLTPFIQDAFRADYIFVAFSGHGGTYRIKRDIYDLPETYIYLNGDECVSERQFFPKEYGKRCTIILDCCRTLDKAIPMHKKASVSNDFVQFSMNFLARECFNQEIKKCEYGITRIYSTEVDHSAEDTHSFTRCMIDGVMQRMSANPDIKVMSLKDATQLGMLRLHEYGVMQVPIYNAGRRHNHFPFAVNI